MYPKERNLHLQLSKDKQQVEGTLTSQGCCWQLELQHTPSVGTSALRGLMATEAYFLQSTSL